MWGTNSKHLQPWVIETFTTAINGIIVHVIQKYNKQNIYIIHKYKHKSGKSVKALATHSTKGSH